MEPGWRHWGAPHTLQGTPSTGPIPQTTRYWSLEGLAMQVQTMSLIINEAICDENKCLCHAGDETLWVSVPWQKLSGWTLCVQAHHTSWDGGTKEANYDSVTSHTVMTLEVTENHMTLRFCPHLSLNWLLSFVCHVIEQKTWQTAAVTQPGSPNGWSKQPWWPMGREVEAAMVQQCTTTENCWLATNCGQTKSMKLMTFNFIKVNWIPAPGGYSNKIKG
jgi:hypothetical protein